MKRALAAEFADHPRSRGVYLMGRRIQAAPFGSSPLARGLHVAAREFNIGAGIIPARAGFTAMSRRASSLGRDHPRSRGVYSTMPTDLKVSAGSSPLARGLRHGGFRSRSRWGIIPARAGFTSGALWGLPSCGDHPRSRGVYQAVAVRSASPTGSSPLARGLPIPLTAECGRGGIIPARAGFTPSSVGWSQRSGDHPRSRGVYRVVVLYLTPPRGSSPLARGLLQKMTMRYLTGGDHPRSRGVYEAFGALGRGSWDHPRSRGVYEVT